MKCSEILILDIDWYNEWNCSNFRFLMIQLWIHLHFLPKLRLHWLHVSSSSRQERKFNTSTLLFFWRWYITFVLRNNLLYDFRFDYCVRVFTTDLANNETQRILKGHRDFVNAVGTYPINNLHSWGLGCCFVLFTKIICHLLCSVSPTRIWESIT